MLLKISDDDPYFEAIVETLKLKFKTGAASKAGKAAIETFFEIEQENQILNAQVESMQSEIDRLRILLNNLKSTSERTKIRRWGNN